MAPAAELVESLNGVSLTDKPPANVLYHKNPIPQDSFEESVYKLIPVEEKIPEKQKMYKSKYADQARTDLKKNKKEAASMGKQKVQANEPEQFLRKGNGLSRLKPGEESDGSSGGEDKIVLRL